MRRTIIFACLLVIALFSSWVFWSNETPAKETTYCTYVVKSGDTLWSIARRHNPQDKDVREVVYAIETHNSITPLVHVGQSIEIPMD